MATAVTLAPSPEFKAFDNNGIPLLNGKLYTYVAGSSTPQATYIDSTGTTPNTNPVVLNARGEASVWLASALIYKLVLQDALGNTIWTQDNVPGGQPLTQATIGQLLYPQTVYEQNAGVTPTNYAYPPGDIKRYGADPTFTIDSTAAIQSACNITQADGSCYVIFSAGRYLVTSITINKNGTYVNQDCTFVGNAATATDCIVRFQSAFTTIGLKIDGNWNINYTQALHWDSANTGSPSQSNVFTSLEIYNTLCAVLYGDRASVINVAQSENYIYGLRTRGIQNCFLVNQINGILKVIGGLASASKNEWDTHQPGVYSYANSYVANVMQGALMFYSCDIEQPSSSSAGVGLINGAGTTASPGGVLQVCGGSWEIACQNLSLGGGYTNITDISGNFWNNSTQSWCVMNASAMTGTSPTLHVGNYILNKSSAVSASNFAFIDFAGFIGWEVSLTDCRLENQLHLIFNNGPGSFPDVWQGASTGNTVQLNNVYSPAVGSGATVPIFQRATSDVNNLLDITGTDSYGSDSSLATWFKRDITGTGSLTYVADAPAGTNYNSCIQIYPQAGGSSAVYSTNPASLTTIKATGIKCMPGDTFMMSGWFKTPSGGPCQVSVLGYTAAGAAQAAVNLADTTAILAGTGWQYVQGMFTVPASCYYIGVGCWGTATNPIRMVGLRVTRMRTEF